MTKYQQFARDNFKVGINDVDEMWHPEIQAECYIMIEEEEQRLKAAANKKIADKKRIGEVVESVADINADLAGRIVVRVSFSGSLPKTKKLTREEKQLAVNLPAGEWTSLVGADKVLFTSKEYDELANFVAKRQKEFASFGIPHIKFQASHVVDILRIPEIEELAEKTEKELAEHVAKLVAVYPSQITAEATKLGPLYNPRDYRPVETLEKLFKFDYDWMSFGVPDELKQFNVKIYEKAKAKAEATWREIEANGILLLRETVAELTEGLVETLTNKETGEKKKFFASSVTKVQEFVESFKRRNICNDSELDAEVEKIGKLVSGLDLKAMSSDMALRERVRKSVEPVTKKLQAMVISASARTITYED